LAGESTLTDLDGADIKGNFEAQTRTIFALMDQTLKRAGGSLNDVVTMTVFLTDANNSATFAKIRKEVFGEKGLPGSAQITIKDLAYPGLVVEVQAVAVVGDECGKGASCLPAGASAPR
jgi:2-iminobutanoate/2-iminopropanoate deaminase